MSDYRALYASLERLGAQIRAAENHLRKHPCRDAVVKLSEEDEAIWNVDFSTDMIAQMEWAIGLSADAEGKLYLIDIGGGGVCSLLSELSSDQMIRFAKYIPELLRLADEGIEGVAQEADSVAGMIEHALVEAAKKPERKKRGKS